MPLKLLSILLFPLVQYQVDFICSQTDFTRFKAGPHLRVNNHHRLNTKLCLRSAQQRTAAPGQSNGMRSWQSNILQKADGRKETFCQDRLCNNIPGSALHYKPVFHIHYIPLVATAHTTVEQEKCICISGGP